MTELRRLKKEIDVKGLYVIAEWLPAVGNRFADSLSRWFPRGGLQIRRQLWRSVRAGMVARLDEFPFQSLAEHPVFFRLQLCQELERDWDRESVRLVFTGVPQNPDIFEAQNEPGTRNACDTEVAAPAMVLTSLGHSVPRDGTGSSAGRNLGSTTHFEPEVARTPSGCDLGRLTSAGKMTDE